MTVVIGNFMLVFIADYASIVAGGIPRLAVAHNLLLLVATVIFTVTNPSIPREASRHLNLRDMKRES